MKSTKTLILLLVTLNLSGCNSAESRQVTTASGRSVTQVEETQSAPGRATGKVTMPDGSPLTGDIRDISITIHGVSDAGERVSYSPAVKNGAYNQKLVPGQFRFENCRITVGFQGTKFTFPLVPVGSNWNKDQDAADGIEQDFVWMPTGQAETYGAKPDPNNHTHWYGLNIGMKFNIYREDLKQASIVPAEGTKLVFTLTPTSKSIDGKDLEPLTIEREWRLKGGTRNDDLNDLPIATYEITGVAQGQDGSTKTILFQGPGDYPNHTAKGTVKVEFDNILGGLAKPPFGWVIE